MVLYLILLFGLGLEALNKNYLKRRNLFDSFAVLNVTKNSVQLTVAYLKGERTTSNGTDFKPY